MWKQQVVSRLRGIAILALLCFAATGAVAAETLEEINQIQSDAYRALTDENFERLNSMANEFRASKARLPDGRWKLDFVVSGLSAKLPRRDAQAWGARLLLIEKWIARTPNDATPYLAKAAVLIDYAWDARGSGYANTVSDTDWLIFRERISRARDVLEQSASISSHNPLWYKSMLTIAKAQAWQEEDFLRLYREGVGKEPTFYFLYFNAATYLLPRWHGSAQKLAEFVDEAVVASERQEGQTLYARIYWSQLSALQDRTFSPGYAKWPRMRQGFEEIVRSYPDNWNLNAFTYYACMAKDWQTAKKMGSRLKSVVPELWKEPQAYQVCMRQAS